MLPVMSCPATCLNPFLRCLVCLSLASRSWSLLSLARYYLALRKCLLSRTSPSVCARARCRPSAGGCRCSGGGTRGAGASYPHCPPWRGGGYLQLELLQDMGEFCSRRLINATDRWLMRRCEEQVKLIKDGRDRDER